MNDASSVGSPSSDDPWFRVPDPETIGGLAVTVAGVWNPRIVVLMGVPVAASRPWPRS